ncbi:PorP/SprF family type IX secretion system membrane protein [Flavobacterium capsici]|uniref:PorP/SprF family type IX secretion system membrane protein n=1 Tax=Flavobacterium capsici TaxID=3075618 RepID=A0AA96F079_9FLAO|nr:MULTISPECIES: PorP/SprF family type IX secretion system membrane protein [unclassified Flavobacterium]WNM19124.1 PorP/SprF family type IX secretion system membrane protein [Flavobacterium sp. PMR2A8]WNM20513.1 PorP/SprF family type IX secretion system membrane protein [Flavobacterium sp. PMTSA4]
MKYKLFFTILIITFSTKVLAQDPVFTQFYLVPEKINPAFTGISNTWSAGLIHRRQWPDGNRKIDTQYGYFNNIVSEQIGVGVTVLNHNEVFTDYNYFQINGAFSYRIELNYDWRMRFGLETGFGRKDYNFSNLLLEDQININDGSISQGSIDPGVLGYSNKINFFDIGVGLVIDQENAWIGAAVKHLTRPDISFIENNNVPLDMMLSVHAGYYFEFIDSPSKLIPEGTDLLFTANYMRQSQYNRLDIGAVMDFPRLSLGIIAATNPERRSDNAHLITSINSILGFKLGEFTFGYSYDLNTSKIQRTQGVHELSLTWQSSQRCDKCDNYKVKLKRNGEAGYQKM